MSILRIRPDLIYIYISSASVPGSQYMVNQIANIYSVFSTLLNCLHIHFIESLLYHYERGTFITSGLQMDKVRHGGRKPINSAVKI